MRRLSQRCTRSAAPCCQTLPATVQVAATTVALHTTTPVTCAVRSFSISFLSRSSKPRLTRSPSSTSEKAARNTSRSRPVSRKGDDSYKTTSSGRSSLIKPSVVRHQKSTHRSSSADFSPRVHHRPSPASTAPAARAAFHAFLHQQNTPYVRSTDPHAGAASDTNPLLIDTMRMRRSSSSATTTGRSVAWENEGDDHRRRLHGQNNDRVDQDNAPQGHFEYDSDVGQKSFVEAAATAARMPSAVSKDGRGAEVLGEWCVRPADTLSQASTSPTPTRRQFGEGRRDREQNARGLAFTQAAAAAAESKRHRGNAQAEDNGDTHHDQEESTHYTTTTETKTHATDDVRQRRYALIEQARRDTTQLLQRRHQREYERTALHVYQLLKRIEGSLVEWSRQRWHRQAGWNAPRRNASREEKEEEEKEENAEIGESTRSSAVHAAKAQDVDAVDARFFEVAGQVQRTLHQMASPHFQAMRGYRLHRRQRANKRATAHTAALSSSSSSGAPSNKTRPTEATEAVEPGQLFHLRLLWRLLHITQLFYTIGRSASLPRSVVDGYVRSANCAYGVREILHVLGTDLARASLSSTHQTTAVGSSSPQLSALTSAGVVFSRDELFQVFYASLCIASEEAPGVPLLNPSTLPHGNAVPPSALQFQLDCVATSAVAARMPIDEWCVRWWCHVYEQHSLKHLHDTAASSSSSAFSASAGGSRRKESGDEEEGRVSGQSMHSLLSMGQAMDVVRATLYATTVSSEVRPNTAAAASSSSSSAITVQTSPFLYFETPPRGARPQVSSPNSARHEQRTTKTDEKQEKDDGGSKEKEGEEGKSVGGGRYAGLGHGSSRHDSVLHGVSSRRRYQPHLVGALGGDRTRLRIPYHLGQRFVTAFLEHLLSEASTATTKDTKDASSTRGETTAGNVDDNDTANHNGSKKDGTGAGEATTHAQTSAAVAKRMRQLLLREDRDAVRDIALLCAAILYFEVYSARTATFMAHAAPLCREQAELLSGHEISCVLLAYATLQRWEVGGLGRTNSTTARAKGEDVDGTMWKSNNNKKNNDVRRDEVTGEFYAGTTVRSASTQAYGGNNTGGSEHGAAEDSASRKDVFHTRASSADHQATAGQQETAEEGEYGGSHDPRSAAEANFSPHRSTDGAPGRPEEASARSSSSSSSSGSANRRHNNNESTRASHAFAQTSSSALSPSWHLFYVTLGSRAGHLSDTLSEEDVTRVLRAMELIGLEHEDLRRAMESSLRMRNLGRRMLYET